MLEARLKQPLDVEFCIKPPKTWAFLSEPGLQGESWRHNTLPIAIAGAIIPRSERSQNIYSDKGSTPMAKAAAALKAPTKTQILANIAEETELSKKDVAAVFDALTAEIAKSLGKGGAGQFAIPGLCKIVLKDVPAKPKRKGRNPADGQEIWLKPKPASKKLSIRPLKGLKEMA